MTARLIAMLRQLDTPLNSIAEVLKLGRPKAARALHDYWRKVEGVTGVKRKVLAQTDKLLKGEALILPEIQTSRVGEQKRLTLEKCAMADELPNVIQEHGNKLIKHATASGVIITGPIQVIYHGMVTMDAEGPVEVCVPVAGPVEPFEDARVRIERAYVQAFARISRAQVAFHEILGAHDLVETWLLQNGRTMTGSPREVYFAGASWGMTTRRVTSPGRMRTDDKGAPSLLYQPPEARDPRLMSRARRTKYLRAAAPPG